MPPILAPLPKSASKRQFFARLGLAMNNRDHCRLYDLMKVRVACILGHVLATDTSKADAAEGRQRIIAYYRTGDLTARDLESDGEASYPSSWVDEQIFDAEVAYIFRNAQPATKILYDLAHDGLAVHSANWIIQWMLWHVFRYRDGRQKPKAGRGSATSEEGDASSALPGPSP